eukprot:CAMPEP_0197650296 /NCGR_PEP_ID=MMETSP1338-20131121/30859_1 /TAXON_ID=43686 ORGANISM="Pelagodinium beii, Strain RCC1491" /NCGR_SAMPLE_ID=MMETSP1338 /ASSEMBLY_ACC=CAM_ASM_000754 /LENGTH=91 /DNA_ID=CAMNT_0043224673 /DNA_START=577 /DNA_END=848 /DNA_ORIENTATION=-
MGLALFSAKPFWEGLGTPGSPMLPGRGGKFEGLPGCAASNCVTWKGLLDCVAPKCITLPPGSPGLPLWMSRGLSWLLIAPLPTVLRAGKQL